MKITRIYNDSEGKSHFEDFEIKLKNMGEIGKLSERFKVKELYFRENDESYDYDWHNPPQPQYIILLDGEIEIEVGDGEIRSFKGGNVLLVEDMEGKGHKTKNKKKEKRNSIFITI